MAKSSLPRDRLYWQPTIDTDACLGDRQCVDFCKNGVFEWDEANSVPIVKQPLNCVLGCTTCADICPVQAIHFPSTDDLRAQMRNLHREIEASGSHVPPSE
jgi:CDP-4-dehydro-6-deoxyglucose reductase